jgi:anti-sigma factor RsiW
VHVPPGDAAAGLRLTGLRQCLFHGGTLAHLSYDYRGHRLSLFVLPGERQVVPSLEIMGMQSVSWTTDTHTYGLVGDVPREELARLAAYFKPKVMP